MSMLGVLGDVASAWLLAIIVVWTLAVLDYSFTNATNGEGWSWGVFTLPGREAMRALLKESRRLEDAERGLWNAAPLLLMVLAGAIVALVPLTEHATYELPVGVLAPFVIFALAGLITFTAGWAARSGYALIAATRALGLVVSCTIPLALSLAGLAVSGGSLELGVLVEAQQDGFWYAVLQPLGFVLYMLCTLILSGWGPVKGSVSVDLAGGIEVEMSGSRLLIWRLGRYLLLFGAAGLAVPLYLGGGEGPVFSASIWAFIKTLALGAALLAIHHWVLAVDFERLMRRAWRVLVPLAIANLLWALVLATVAPGLGGIDGFGT